MLRSRQRRLAIGQKVSAAMVALEPAERTLLMDTLGDLALSLVCRPKSAWSGSPDELAEAVGARGSNVAALLSVHVAADVGLLVGAAGGGLRFRDADAVTWLAARRTAASRDARGLGVYRLHGALFDVFAMAVAELDEASAMPMVQALAVPGDDAWTALELSTLQAVAACAWGAAADGAERASMRPCAAPAACFTRAARRRAASASSPRANHPIAIAARAASSGSAGSNAMGCSALHRPSRDASGSLAPRGAYTPSSSAAHSRAASGSTQVTSARRISGAS